MRRITYNAGYDGPTADVVNRVCNRLLQKRYEMIEAEGDRALRALPHAWMRTDKNHKKRQQEKTEEDLQALVDAYGDAAVAGVKNIREPLGSGVAGLREVQRRYGKQGKAHLADLFGRVRVNTTGSDRCIVVQGAIPGTVGLSDGHLAVFPTAYEHPDKSKITAIIGSLTFVPATIDTLTLTFHYGDPVLHARVLNGHMGEIVGINAELLAACMGFVGERYESGGVLFYFVLEAGKKEYRAVDPKAPILMIEKEQGQVGPASIQGSNLGAVLGSDDRRYAILMPRLVD